MTEKTVTVSLDEPVSHDGKTYASLTLRKMKAKDLVAGDLVTGDTRRAFAIFASMAGVPIGVIEELDVDDFERLGQEAAPLMGKSAQAAMTKPPAQAAQ
ncbi:phage tail assembly protein [Kaistia granuli]|uniref:phage tail assembly protein n=1 Tax=Kaistia granuli TaxID=363259 RepID=UPI00036EE738|nr:phage tail assembly protein [Kaistia granuli]